MIYIIDDCAVNSVLVCGLGGIFGDEKREKR